MTRHRREPPPRVRPRYPRIGAAFTAAAITMLALLGGIGLLPLHGHPTAAQDVRLTGQQIHPGSSGDPATAKPRTPESAPAPSTTPSPSPTRGHDTASALPADSGEGRRVVFAISEQRVWLVDRSDEVVSTYLVSGSLTDNLRPGRYEVYSRSRWAVGVDESGVMQYFVRFAHGKSAAIGFHSIPTHLGKPLQSSAELGTPQSHGCIRQAMPDAQRMWRFAQTGTRVVVTA